MGKHVIKRFFAMMCFPIFSFVEGSMKRIKMTIQDNKTFGEGFEEYVLDMKARNLREGTIRHVINFIVKFTPYG